MSADYYLVPGSIPSSAKMHILTNGLANIGSTDGQLVTNAASTLSLSVNGNVNSGGNIGGSVGVTTAPYYSLNPTGGTSGTAIIIPNGSTSQRPPLEYSLPGYLRYNTDSSYSTLEYYRNKQNVYLQLYSPPNVTSISPTTLKLNVGAPDASINIFGSNFDTSYPMSVIFYTKNYIASYIAPNIKINSSASMTVTVPTGVYNGSSASSNSPYTIRVISEFTGMGYTFFNALTIVDGSFSFIAPSSLNTVYTSRSYSRSTFIAGTYGATAPPQIVATYEGITVTNYKFNPASAGYIDVSNNGLTIDASGFITGTIKNGYVATTKTVSVGVIAGSNSSYDTSANTTLNLIFAPLLLSTTSSLSQNSIVTSSPTYTYYYYEVTNTNAPSIIPNPALSGVIPSSNNPTQGAASSVTATITLAPCITGTSIYSADPSYSYLDFLIVGGGGGGGCGWQGGGGGAGGLVSSGNNPNYTYGYTIGSSGGGGAGVGPYQVPQGITTAATITVSVGGGGTGGYVAFSTPTPYSGRSGNGANSYITFPTGNSGTITYTAYGGGGGGGEQDQGSQIITGTNFQPFPGGSGGGSSHGPTYLYTPTVFTATYSGTASVPNYILTISAISSGTIIPFAPVYTGSNPATGTLIGYISTFGTNGTTGTGLYGGGIGTYYLTGLTTTSSTSSFPTTALGASTTSYSSTTFSIPAGTSASSGSQVLVYNGQISGIPISNYSVGYNSQGYNDTVSGFQGYNGGYGMTNGPYVGGGGGGAGQAGSNATAGPPSTYVGIGGAGGNGIQNYIKTATYATVGTGIYYAGGGGGCSRTAAASASGGLGGGGTGQNLWTSGSSDAAFTGLGGGGGAAGAGGGPPSTTGESSGRGGGGSVIIRYRGI